MKKSYFIFALCAAIMLTSTAMALTQVTADCSKLDPSDPKYCPSTLAPDPSLSGSTINKGEFVAGEVEDLINFCKTNPTDERCMEAKEPDPDVDDGGTEDNTDGTEEDTSSSYPEYVGNPDVLSCNAYNCSNMGYSQASVNNCETYVKCPFDVSYQICTKYKEAYTLSSCPTGANCNVKYKVTGCEDGYTLETDANTGEKTCSKAAETCTATLTDCPTGYKCSTCARNGIAYFSTIGCASGFEYGASSSGLSGLKSCYKSACKVDIVSELSDKYVKLDNGGFYVYGCNDGYSENTSTEGCTVCRKQATTLPVDPVEEKACPTFDTCPVGAICTLNWTTYKYTISDCEYGYIARLVIGNSSCIQTCLKRAQHD